MSEQVKAPDWTWWWGYGSEPEQYEASFATREAAIADAKEHATEAGTEFTICEGKPWPLRDNIFDADHVMDRFHDWNDDRCDEDGDLHMDPTPEQRGELETVLNDAFKAWREKHNLGRAWALDTRNDEVVMLDPVAADAAEGQR